MIAAYHFKLWGIAANILFQSWEAVRNFIKKNRLKLNSEKMGCNTSIIIVQAYTTHAWFFFSILPIGSWVQFQVLVLQVINLQVKL